MTATPAAVVPGADGAAALARVLVVCTANICRSPVAEALLARTLGPGAEVTSAGLHARIGSPVDEEMAQLLGGPVDGFAARQLTVPLVTGADLVLVMTRAHRAAVVDLVPSAVRRTFTLREFADLAVLAAVTGDGPSGDSVGTRIAEVVRQAPRLRALRAPSSTDDVEDPYRRGRAAHEVAMAAIQQCVAAIAGAVDTGRGDR